MILLKVRQIRNDFFQADVSSKKRMNKFDFTTCRLVFIRFLEEIEDIKKTFRNYLTFSRYVIRMIHWTVLCQPWKQTPEIGI